MTSVTTSTKPSSPVRQPKLYGVSIYPKFVSDDPSKKQRRPSFFRLSITEESTVGDLAKKVKEWFAEAKGVKFKYIFNYEVSENYLSDDTNLYETYLQGEHVNRLIEKYHGGLFCEITV